MILPEDPMPKEDFTTSDEIRTRFSRAMSEMYRLEVPQYGTLLELVADVNAQVLERGPELRPQLERTGELDRLNLERHGAIRLGTPEELATIRRVFAVMGMVPVGYYDLAVACIPVHATAFRPIEEEALRANPFRVFTSLLRLELIPDPGLRREAEATLASRKIFTPRAVALTERFETQGGLTADEAAEFVSEALETFRWHSEATVTQETYRRLHDAHRLIADVVSFKGPHINHLTPRTLDIDAVQKGMPGRGITPKAAIEGPPRRRVPILLRQTSFKALEERIRFVDEAGQGEAGTHTARFGEIEQRGLTVTAAGRKVYDTLLTSVREEMQVGPKGRDTRSYEQRLAARFDLLPDDLERLRSNGLAFFHYSPTTEGLATAARGDLPEAMDDLVARGYVNVDPMIYEDFLPVSAAGIFQSNLGTDVQENYAERANRGAFEEALGQPVLNELELYSAAQATSIQQTLADLGQVCNEMARPTLTA
ncbi:2-oxoadipate dioxygenase/decarboxylase HglS [Roseomonas chloroacetimidivorans]|uniref:2-oxoadipate dioxygenase/decarboxylase HglS n=1 Tax=Roseomonas chloroacetimidivorans TaxID=1766656 RepID=UPI003C768B40